MSTNGTASRVCRGPPYWTASLRFERILSIWESAIRSWWLPQETSLGLTNVCMLQLSNCLLAGDRLALNVELSDEPVSGVGDTYGPCRKSTNLNTDMVDTDG